MFLFPKEPAERKMAPPGVIQPLCIILLILEISFFQQVKLDILGDLRILCIFNTCYPQQMLKEKLIYREIILRIY